MIFLKDDLPPIFDPDAPKFDIAQRDSITHNLTKPEPKKLLDDKGFNGDRNVDTLRIQAHDAGIQLTETKTNLVPGLLGNQRELCRLHVREGLYALADSFQMGPNLQCKERRPRRILLLGQQVLTNQQVWLECWTNAVTSKMKKTQLMYILDLLGVELILTPKCHPEIAGCGVDILGNIRSCAVNVTSMMQFLKT